MRIVLNIYITLNLLNDKFVNEDLDILRQTRMWANAKRDGHPAEYRWRPLQKFRNSIPCTTPQLG